VAVLSAEALGIVIITLAVTIYVCSNSLREKPSTLMLPRAPKAGKRILLERIDLIWPRMKFTYKSTARNIMRYKRHLYLTVIGIAGCTALVLTGFGLLDSIGSIANTQFKEIFCYDYMVELDDVKKLDTVLEEYLNGPQIESFAETFSETAYLYGSEGKMAVTVNVPENPAEIRNTINFRDRKSGNEIEFNDSSVVMSEKLAETMGLKIGDTFELENEDNEKAEFKLTGIYENYVGRYVYINKQDYAEAFKKELPANTLMVDAVDGTDEEEVTTKLLSSESVMNVEPVTQIKKSFDSLLSNIKFIVFVLIIAAGALAVIVLYNLTNININERRKELSTLKVLGYHSEEIAAYVYRETTILSIIGTFAGLFFGAALHKFVVKTVEASNLMMGRNISLMSYVWSAVITMIFTLFVNLILYKKLKNIEMVESMKAID
jgi:putative ABC transport system permease protein